VNDVDLSMLLTQLWVWAWTAHGSNTCGLEYPQT